MSAADGMQQVAGEPIYHSEKVTCSLSALLKTNKYFEI